MDKNQGIKIDKMPKWMNISMIILKWLMVMLPFIISSIVFFVYDVSGINEWMWTCIYIMSLTKIIDMADSK